MSNQTVDGPRWFPYGRKILWKSIMGPINSLITHSSKYLLCLAEKKEMLVWNNLFKSIYLCKQFHISSKSVKP